ncbi:MAG: DUF692 domain-containing protein [Gammaproteobacteria bacterium]|nr:DUF692 domain-containing protein [Gammaproteobacteria bacterium]
MSGVGIGLRDPHFDALMGDQHGVPWVELLADNFLAAGGLVPRQLERIAERFPVTLHCVGMNLGGSDPLDMAYLAAVRTVAARTAPAWISDHLCFSACHGRHYHDLLPLPYSDEAVRHVAARIGRIQDFLDRRLVVENVSAYLRADAPLSEAEFVAAVAAEADCELLLDVNNLYVNQVNLGLDAADALDRVPRERVREIHLAGHETRGDYLVDAHNSRVSAPVWALFAQAAARLPDVAVCIEWDNDIPPLDVLLDEMRHAGELQRQARAEVA